MRAPFTLTKWYFDCAAADGRAVIGYWASLAWGSAALTWQNVTVYEKGRPPVVRSSLAAASPPEVSADGVLWRAPALGCVARIASLQPPIEARLLEVDAGVVDWRAEAPAADVAFELDGCVPVRGSGYAERIFISVPPWCLPIRELRWGRWVDAAAERSVVWIDWRDDRPRTWVFVDGVEASAPVVTDHCIRAGGASLALRERRTLHTRAFAEIAATIPPLRAIVPNSFLALRETKWCSAGALHESNGRARTGWAIHEVAVFR
jgi:hypothetical protein